MSFPSLSANDPIDPVMALTPQMAGHQPAFGAAEEPDMIRRLFDSSLFGSNAPYLEGLYEDYLRDSGSVSPEWGNFFEKLT